MSVTKVSSTNSQIRPLLLNELEHVSGGASQGRISAAVASK